VKVLVAAMEWDYGIPARGRSFEYMNLYDAMRHMDGVQTCLFDFMAAYQDGGQELVRERLLDAVAEYDPDLVFAVLFRDEVPPDVLVELRDRPRPLTFNWFCDDHWRFEDFTSKVAPLFNACSTTARSALPKYERLGYTSVIKTQWACNQNIYRRTGQPLTHDVTFVGQPHGDRRQVIGHLAQRGIGVETRGTGWPEGRLGQDEMVSMFAESRINLNLSNSSTRSLIRRLLGRRFGDQIKGRNFEIPGCGGFQLSGRSEDLESYFEPDKEIVLFASQEELVEKIQRYLKDEPARAAIAEAGYRRAIGEHTYDQRFKAIFEHLAL
jgi:spore maturation protein CgeB